MHTTEQIILVKASMVDEERLAALSQPRSVDPATARARSLLKQCYHVCSLCGQPRRGGRCGSCTIDSEGKRMLARKARNSVFWGECKGIVVDEGRRLSAVEARRSPGAEALRLHLSSTSYHI